MQGRNELVQLIFGSLAADLEKHRLLYFLLVLDFMNPSRDSRL